MWQKIKQFFIRFFHGSKISLLSLKAYYHYKKLLLFPLLNSVFFASAVLILMFCIIPLDTPISPKDMTYTQEAIAIIIMIFFYFLLFLSNAFFKVATVYAVADYCETNSTSIFATCGRATKTMKLIASWAVVETGVRFLAGSKKEGAVNDASLTSFIMGTSWSYISFFIYPIIAFERTTLFNAIKKSTHFMKQYFGTISGSLFAFGLYYRFFAFIMLGLLFLHGFIGSGIMWLINILGLDHYLALLESKHTTHTVVFLLMSYVLIIFFFMLQIMLTAEVIVSTLLYRHIHKQSTGFLTSKTIEDALYTTKNNS